MLVLRKWVEGKQPKGQKHTHATMFCLKTIYVYIPNRHSVFKNILVYQIDSLRILLLVTALYKYRTLTAELTTFLNLIFKRISILFL